MPTASRESTVTLRDVAERAGVSKSVASRALNGDVNARISAETALRVRRVAEEMKYVPNHQARLLRAARAGALALIVPDVNNAVFADLFAGVQAVASRADMTVLLGEMDRAPGELNIMHGLLRQGRVDGVILQRADDIDDRSLRSILSRDEPVVLFNSRLPRHPGSVTLADERAASLATEHLVGLGHRKIGFIGGSSLHDAARRRLKGFRTTLRSHRIEVPERWIVESGWEVQDGIAGMRHLLKADSLPTGVVVASVNAALGAAAVAIRSGRRIPEDLSVVTVQDTWAAAISNPPLTVVRMPMRRAGEIAAESLLERLSGKDSVDVVVDDPAPELVVRASTAPLSS